MSNAKRRGGLGRGLGSLIPTQPEVPSEIESPDSAAGITTAEEPLPVPGATFREIEISAIHANAKQPRQVFEEEALRELAHSIAAFGVLQPVVVRPDGESYELVMGSGGSARRRWPA